MGEVDALDWWLRSGSVYGIAVVFLTSVLLLLVWIAYETVSVVKKWVLEWLKKSIDSHEKVCLFLDAATESLDRIEAATDTTKDGVSGVVNAAVVQFTDKESRERYGVKSDVIIALQSTKKILDGDKRNN